MSAESTKKVVIGAGPVGWTVAEQLADDGAEVTILTRSGSGPDNPGITRVAADANDPIALKNAFTGADAVFHAVHAAYDVRAWRDELPKAEQVVMDAAADAGAVVVFPESLYSYTRPQEPMSEDNPRDWPDGKGAVRAELIRARAAHPTPTVSVVASDFVGPRVRTSHMGERVLPAVLAGKKVRVLGSLDQPHSWTFMPDLARAMITAAGREDLHDTVLHAPTAAPSTQRELIHAFAQAAGVEIPEPGTIPRWLLRKMGLANVQMRELAEMLYQFEQPFVIDSTRSQTLLGQAPTPRDEVAAQTVAWWRR